MSSNISVTAESDSVDAFTAAGTALGDPIEVGAAVAVLHGGQYPLNMTAVKSWVGHAEPAAGIVGTLHSFVQASFFTHNPVARLTTVNPYVSNTLAGMDAAGQPQLLRQQAAVVHQPPVDQGSAQLHRGASAFAFQGTNAHVILTVDHRISSNTPVGATHGLWHRARLWYICTAHCLSQQYLVRRLRNQSTTVCIETELRSAHLGFILDHKVSAVYAQEVIGAT
jgi:acyl transferase domain-containing protein